MLANYAEGLRKVNGPFYLTGLNDAVCEQLVEAVRIDEAKGVRGSAATGVIGQATRSALADARVWLSEVGQSGADQGGMEDAAWDRLQSLLGLGAEALDAGQMALRAALTFIVMLAIVRLGDKRLFGKGTAFDLVVAIMLGSVMSRAITGSSPLLATWVAGLVLIVMHWLMASLSFHLDWFGPLVKGHPILLLEDGEIQRDGMREGSVTEHDLDQVLRMDGEAPDPSTVARAYLERDGSISVIQREKAPRLVEVSVQDGVQTVRIALE